MPGVAGPAGCGVVPPPRVLVLSDNSVNMSTLSCSYAMINYESGECRRCERIKGRFASSSLASSRKRVGFGYRRDLACGICSVALAASRRIARLRCTARPWLAGRRFGQNAYRPGRMAPGSASSCVVGSEGAALTTLLSRGGTGTRGLGATLRVTMIGAGGALPCAAVAPPP